MRHINIYLRVILCCMCLIFSISTQASTSVGTIDSAYKITRICQDVSCGTYGSINFSPTGSTPLSITDSGITGYAWGDQVGWINMSPVGGGVFVNPNTGVLTGTAFSSVSGWINFSPTGQGVTLVDNGAGSNFSGYAWVSGAYGGWLRFDCTQVSTCVKTDWRTVVNRSVAQPQGSNVGGSTSQISTTASVRENPRSELIAFGIAAVGDTLPNSLIAGSPAELASPQVEQYTILFRSDIDDNKRIDVFDFNLLMVNWGKKQGNKNKKITSDRSIADVNSDTSVDISDFNLIMINWGRDIKPIAA